MPNKQNKKQLTQEDLAAIYAVIPEKEWPVSRLQLVWSRCIPENADLDAALYFLYGCHKRGLDPILGECYLRIQFDRNSGTYTPIVIVGINGALKVADATQELDGVSSPEFVEDDTGIISASVNVYKRSRNHPFTATVYFKEYCAMKDGKPNYMWSTKGHMMLGKCATMAALRLAFAASLGGFYISEEFAQHDSASPVPFVVESTDPEPTSDVRRKPVVTAPPEPEPPLLAPASPRVELATKTQTLRQGLKAQMGRLSGDLAIPKEARKAAWDSYFRGFLMATHDTVLSKEPELYLKPLEVLEHLTMAEHEKIRSMMLAEPYTAGEYALAIYQDWFEGQGDNAALAHSVALKFEFETPSDVDKYMRVNGIQVNQPADVAAFLRLALIERELARDAASRANVDSVGIAFVVDDIEAKLQGDMESFTATAVRDAFEKETVTDATT